MHCNFAVLILSVVATQAQRSPHECAESGLQDDGAEARVMSIQMLQSNLHISKGVSHQGLSGGLAHTHSRRREDQEPHEDSQMDRNESVHAAEHPENTGSAADRAGVGFNQDDDIYVFLSSLAIHSGTCVGCILAFCLLRILYPQIYANNVAEKIAPATPDASWFGWAFTAWYTPTEASAKCIGLDNAMLLEFCELAMKILLIIGIPLVCIEGPMHWLVGANAAGEDYLSYLSFGNVAVGHPWIYYVHCAFIWFVVLTVQICIYQAQAKFMKRRTQWLLDLPQQQTNTVLVEGIPPLHRSDKQVKDFFERMLGTGSVEKAMVVKDTRHLRKLVARREKLEQKLQETEDDGSQSKAKVTLSEVEKAIVEERERVRVQSQLFDEPRKGEERGRPDKTNLGNAFVTFKKRRTANIALHLRFNPDAEVWACSTPPVPRDILWQDLTADPNAQAARDVVGYACLVGLYFAYMPLVVGIANVAAAIDLGPLNHVWRSLAPTMGLQIMVAFLPTILLIIFRSFFIIHAEAWSQTRLQNWYFWFQVMFVIVVTAIGDSVVHFTTVLIEEPMAIFGALANSMPHATHFYMNFLILQWSTHCMNLLRYVPLTKFIGFRKLYGDEDAKRMAEPEDQNYYGIGSRSARFAINMAIGIIYSTLSPPVALLAFVNFAVCRLVYGYLIPFAETKKPDLGGAFWVQQLHHVFCGSIIYCVLMTGVLFHRAPTPYPAFIVAPSIFYVAWSFERFRTQFLWLRLPFDVVGELGDAESENKVFTPRRTHIASYVQPEMETAYSDSARAHEDTPRK